jgi:hypothetical protein
MAEKFDVRVNVAGGGPNGQADAVRHGIARALIQFDANLRPPLKAEGLLTRDPRMRERKKYGQPGARKRFQFSASVDRLEIFKAPLVQSGGVFCFGRKENFRRYGKRKAK